MTADLDSLEYSLDDFLPDFQRTDPDTVATVSLLGLITIGLGLGTLLLSSLLRSMRTSTLWIAGNNTYAGALEFSAVFGAMIAATIGLIAYIDYLNYPTAYNALRAWKRNFLVFLIVIAVNTLPLNSMFMDISLKTNTAIWVMVLIGTVFNGIGIWLAWSMKQLWIMLDPERSLVANDCDFGNAMYDPEEFAELSEEDDIYEDQTSVAF